MGLGCRGLGVQGLGSGVQGRFLTAADRQIRLEFPLCSRMAPRSFLCSTWGFPKLGGTLLGSLGFISGRPLFSQTPTSGAENEMEHFPGSLLRRKRLPVVNRQSCCTRGT